ncbi:DUF3240 family protein [Duganella sp. BJB1802]|uniref:DUF3240 family protein n=1 Tax=Duganella sp. BJB1802 TaxID=2744575 RepID=UPI0015932157|nr:DUF3240 family protein [Duganella sp. BJB1802]NVD70582.1 DUF3240 family protein [Duganella sp. BJB1802]
MLKQISNDSLLTLAIPAALEEDVLDFLLLHPEWATGFSVVAAQGMGKGAVLRSAMELVQGRSGRKLVLVAGVGAHLQLLLEALANEIPSPDVTYWLSPLSACGRLA